MKKLYILTGGSGTGKSTVLKLLKKKGFPVVEEAARKIIAEENAKVKGLSRHHKKFPMFLARKQLDAEQALPETVCFLDRGIVDNLAYILRADASIPWGLNRLIRKAGYENEVFFFEMPPQSVYGSTGETFEPYEKSVEIHELLEKVYKEKGFKLIHVPFASFRKQADFIEREVNKLNTS